MRSSAARNPNPDANPTRNRRRIRNTEIRFPFTFSAAAGSRAKKGGRGGGAATPQLRWKFSDSDPVGHSASGSEPQRVSDSGKDKGARTARASSARKLAAAVWHTEMLALEMGPAKPDLVHRHLSNGLKHGFNPKDGSFQKNSLFPDPSMERATKWDEKRSKPSNEVYQSFDHLKLLIDQQITQSSSLESKFKAELDLARARISKLESKRHSLKKKLEHTLRKHAEEKASWRIREHQKIQAFIDGMQEDLSIERKNRRRVEILNSKLLDELSEAKKSAKRFLHDYGKEKKARELLEDVCDQLAKEVGEDKTDVEESKIESIRVREELEEERKMLQMAEVWREERVQMKLIDAKLALEDQCSQLKKLQYELESFLRSRTHSNLNAEQIKEAELLIEAVAESVKSRDMKEFVYNPPPASEDIFTMLEELQNREEPKERDVCDNNSEIQSDSPATDIFLEKPINGSIDDDSDWETLSRGDLNSSNSLEGSGESSCDINVDLRKKASANISKLWMSAKPDNGGNCKRESVDSIAKGRMSTVGFNEGAFCPQNLENWSSPDSTNPHVTRGMKGCIEWPRGAQKQSLKAKLLEARLDSNKVQIRHVLKQKI